VQILNELREHFSEVGILKGLRLLRVSERMKGGGTRTGGKLGAVRVEVEHTRHRIAGNWVVVKQIIVLKLKQEGGVWH
jgi:hypothetical protein